MTSNENLNFPPGFLLGVATSAYQVEGAWNEDGKSESVWDHLCHSKPETIPGCENGDVACDSYHRYKEDVQMVKELGMDFYRFSFSWTRILPLGIASKVNQSGIDYYNRLIDELLDNGIQPMATIFHWDMPQVLQDMGGWMNSLIVDYFEDYARILFQYFGDRVKWWLTINEPATIALGYSDGKSTAPLSNLHQYGAYIICSINMLKAHAQAYHLYKTEFREQKGKVGIALAVQMSIPFTNSEEDIRISNTVMEICLHLYTHPILSKNGGFSDFTKEICEDMTQRFGLCRPVLPELGEEWINKIKGTSDYLGLNHYTTVMAKTSEENNTIGSLRVLLLECPDTEKTALQFFNTVPWGFRKVLQIIKDEYDNPEVFVTENGYSDFDGTLQDEKRINYFKSYLSEMLKAIHEDGCAVIGYTAWSLMDNFEWTLGYGAKFGLYRVDFDDPERRRTARDSAKLFAKIAKSRSLNI